MQLCLECGRIEEHHDECPRRPPAATSPAEKTKRVQKAMAVAQAVLAASDETAKGSAKLAIVKLAAAEGLLERYSNRDLAAFDQKRAHNDLATALAKKRDALEESSGAGRRFTEDARFAKQAVETLFAQALRREEARRFDSAALAKLPRPIEGLDRPLKKIAEAIETRVAETRSLDEKIAAWGWKNLGRLMLGLDPLEVPAELEGDVGVLGKLGVGKRTRRLTLVAAFKPLGEQFRERLYLIGANSILLPVVSRLAQAEEAWRRLLAKEGGAERWERVKKEKELLEYLLGDEPRLPAGVEDVVAMLAASSRALRVLGLRSPSEIKGHHWEAWAKGYFLELDQVTAGDMSSDEFGTQKLAKLLIEKRQGEEPDPERALRVMERLHDTWRASPPRGNPRT